MPQNTLRGAPLAVWRSTNRPVPINTAATVCPRRAGNGRPSTWMVNSPVSARGWSPLNTSHPPLHHSHGMGIPAWASRLALNFGHSHVQTGASMRATSHRGPYAGTHRVILPGRAVWLDRTSRDARLTVAGQRRPITRKQVGHRTSPMRSVPLRTGIYLIYQ